jgi:hypothetical protein
MKLEKYTIVYMTEMSSAVELDTPVLHICYQLILWTEQSLTDKKLSALQQALRFGAILYIETLQSSPVRGIDVTVILFSLRCQLVRFDTTHLMTADISLWLLFIGGSASENPCRFWFTKKLVEAATQAIKTWEDAKLLLFRFWWVKSINERPCQQLWEEAINR